MKAKRLMTKMPVFPMVILAAALALVSCDNETKDDGGVSGNNVPGSSLADKLAWLRNNSGSGGNYVLELSADEAISSSQRLEYTGRNNITITLRGSERNRTINFSTNGNMFQISTGITLVLDKNITLRGRGVNTHPLIYVMPGGALRMNNGSAITGNTATNYSGGGVWVEGTFSMSGGTISRNATRNAGGGVNVLDKGNFIMSGGTISGNDANNVGGGVNVVDKGTFIMSGGTISGNVATNGGGGVCTQYGNFTMSGGTISGNNSHSDGGGVFTTNSRNAGGSILGIGNFIMNGGTISGNTARDGGGGVAVSNEGTFILNSGSITGNTGVLGGGVAVAIDTAFTMSGGTIYGNIAKTNGGGVHVLGAFTKTGGIITGYFSDRRNGNVVSRNPTLVESVSGHAVYANYPGSGVTKRKETTANSGESLSYAGKTGSFSGEWDY